jgi:aryl-alcohol dehydrogenase-like predicted oxidoreductase
MGCSWDRVVLGRTGLRVTPLGLAPSRDLPAREVERAFERGVNYLYWGTARRAQFGAGIRAVAARRREDAVLVVQSYTRAASLMRPSLERALRQLGTEYVDVLLLGWWNQPPPQRIVDAALALRERGRARHIMISCHRRPSFARYLADETYGAIMVRYNAAHPGAEREVFPLLDDGGAGRDRRAGVVSYTATRWGALLDPALTPPGERTPRASDCYRFVLSNPAVDVCLTGPGDAAELDENLTVLDRGPMSADEIAWIKRVGAQVRTASASQGGNAPIEMLDRVSRWFSRDEGVVPR